ncbi:MAG: RNA 2',3'-cyclic phosphodiesterase [Pseudomonadota bacterium]
MQRVFVALDTPEIVADALSQLQFGLDGARWRSPEGFHLTLQFIGDVDRHLIADIALALDGVSAPTFSLTLAGCGVFGDKKPRSLWAGVAANDALDALQMKVESALRRTGAPLENRKFKPHVTLAYLKGVPSAAAETFCAMHGLFKCGPFPVTAFHLYESFLGGDEAHYEHLTTYPLSSSR